MRHSQKNKNQTGSNDIRLHAILLGQSLASMIYFDNRANFMTNGSPGISIVAAAGKTVFADDQMAEILGVASRSGLIANPSATSISPQALETSPPMFDSN